ncbi:hypothetical protein [Paraglaciecola chathamensis]|uniref:Uncharacterized protein n=1 Tax=Paraglaciecola agarilytica NO2 TaxID=1125747 RepID=A0ABQ0I1W1_9ALTE|nr:hypothetical protein [Paraglaciecola agarilytica]GAC03320.1 hypothetical protein GAGA_0455 [Paraglaciecola agarilytica NO2]
MSISLASQSTVLNIATWIRENTTILSTLTATDIAKKIYWQNAESYAARYNESAQAWNDTTQVTETLTRTKTYSELRYILIGNCYEGDTTEEISNFALCLRLLNAILANPLDIDSYDTVIGKFVTVKNTYSNAYYDAYILEVDHTGLDPKYTIGAFDIFNDKWLITTRSDRDITINDCRPQLSNTQTVNFKTFIQEQLDAEKQANRNKAKAEQDAHNDYIKHIEQYMPENTKAVIVAQNVTNTSNSLEDYHGSATNQTIILAWSTHTRNLFPEMRKAAALHEDTKHLAALPKDCEHKRAYSSLNAYLKETANEFADGWLVHKVNLFDKGASWVPQGVLAEHITNPNPPKKITPKKKDLAKSTDNSESEGGEPQNVALRFNESKHGIELVFSDKPVESVLSLLRASRFRYHKKYNLWYAKNTECNLADANQIMVESGVAAVALSGQLEQEVKEKGESQILSMRELLFGVS